MIRGYFQKQPPEVFYYKSCSSKFRNIHRKTTVLESLLKKGLQHRCFRVNTGKYLRTPILENSCEQLLLYFKNGIQYNFTGIGATAINFGQTLREKKQRTLY